MGSEIAIVYDHLAGLGVVFVFFTFPLGIFYFLLRPLFSKKRPFVFSYWPIVFLSFGPFLLLYFGDSFSFLFCISGLFVGVVSGYILEKLSVYLSKIKPTSGSHGRDPTRFIGNYHSSSRSSPPSSSSHSSSGSGSSNFGGGGFSGGGGSGSW